MPRSLPHVLCGPWKVHKPHALSQLAGERNSRRRLSCVEGDCLMSGVVALTSRRVTSWSSPQAWTSIFLVSRVVSSTGEKIIGLSSLSRPPSLDMCCPGCFSQVAQGGHVLWLCKQDLTCQLREASIFDNSALF